MRVLVTGGAGYIGSVVVEELLAAGAERVVVLDDLSKGHAGAVLAPATLVRGNIGDAARVRDLCASERIDAVVHMAASSLVGESVTDPAKYYENNVVKALRLYEALRAAGVRRFVFSSTAATYGEPERSPIDETLPNLPTNPYGESKLAFERALGWYARAYGMAYVSLRYFNAAGATARNGEQHDPETHLIPIVLDVARGKRASVQIYGDDYPTPDGTCVRDYIHVSDLARAHVLSLQHLEQGGASSIFNLGCGGGYSVKQVIEAARKVTGKAIETVVAPRRPGDPAVLVASSERARPALGWSPQKQEVEAIVADAWAWLQAHPDGYDKDGGAP
jgi:UDP-glucose 4-epimerase